jgi:tRNA(Arg) A34 adenosine deaminase TadA
VNDEPFMRRAIALSLEGMLAGRGGPFGAVVVRDGRIVGEGTNAVLATNDPTAHAEVTAIRAACRALATFQLAGGVLYTSCEPCPMCLGAVYWARLDRIYFANTRADARRIGFDDDWIHDELALPPDARRVPATRLLAAEARAAFDVWAAKPDKTPY